MPVLQGQVDEVANETLEQKEYVLKDNLEMVFWDFFNDMNILYKSMAPKNEPDSLSLFNNVHNPLQVILRIQLLAHAKTDEVSNREIDFSSIDPSKHAQFIHLQSIAIIAIMKREYLSIESLPVWARLNGVSVSGIAFKRLQSDGTDKGSAIIAEGKQDSSSKDVLLQIPSDLILSLEAVDTYAKSDRYLREVLEAVGGFGKVLCFLSN